MPIEKRADETRDEFVSRCVSKEMDGGMPQEQALAVCLTYADEYFTSATASVTDNTWSTEAPINVNFKKVKRVLFNEDFNEEDVIKWKDLGYKVSILSKRKIKRQDKKVWNRLKNVGLSEQDLVFGSVQEVDKRWNFDILLTGEDPVLEKFMTLGEEFNPKKVLSSQVVESMEEAEKAQEILLKSVEMKFVTVKVVYTYEEIPGIPDAKSGSRPFCSRMMSAKRQYTLDEIRQLSNRHLIELGYGSKYAGLQPDVFQWRGGFYRLPGTLNTTAWCRHQWKANVVMS